MQDTGLILAYRHFFKPIAGFIGICLILWVAGLIFNAIF